MSEPASERGGAGLEPDLAGAAPAREPPVGCRTAARRLGSEEGAPVAEGGRRRFVAAPVDVLSRSRAGVWLRLLWQKYQGDEASIRAMGLTYTTILSLVPFLAVAFSLLQAFGFQNQLEPTLARGLAPLGAEAAEVSRRIVEFVGNMRVGVLGALGVAGLFYTVVSLIGTIESSFNRIWRVRRGRTWTEKFRDYLSAVLVGPVLVFAALALTASAQSSTLVQGVLSVAPRSLALVLTSVAPYLLLAFAFTTLYRLMPNTRVSLAAAAAGGAFAGAGWKLAGTAFAAFVAGSGRYAAIYSSFAILILFLFWVYVSWSITLAGAEIAYLTDHFEEERRLGSAARFEGWERSALCLLMLLRDRHEAGLAPIPRRELAERVGLTDETTAELTARLLERRIVLLSAEPPGIALARPPERVSIAEAIAAATRLSDDAALPPDPIAEILRLRHRKGLEAVQGLSLASLRDDSTAELEAARHES